MAVGRPEQSTKVSVGLDGFVAGLAEVGLMNSEQVGAFLEGFPPKERPSDVSALAQALVEAGRLTRFQAAAATQGRARGLVLGPYLILDKLGAGGMGTVFKARNRRNGRIVALKALFPSMTKHSSSAPRLRREAQAAAQLNHPNLVAALDLDEIAGMLVFVMDYAEGCDLSRMVRKQGPLEVDRAIDCIIQAARGLHAAHERGIFHRDVKPANLLLGPDGTVKVLDLGLARIDQDAEAGEKDEYADGLTRAGAVLGTVDYMAPEQAMNSREADARSDIYSLGCTLYYTLVGRPPYRGGGALERLLRHRDAPIPSMRAERPDVPPELDDVLKCMLAKKPSDRYASMAELADALARCKEPHRDGARHVRNTLPVTSGLEPTVNGDPATTVNLTPQSTFLDLSLDDTEGLPSDASRAEALQMSRGVSLPRIAGGIAAVLGVAVLVAAVWFSRTREPAPQQPAPPPIVMQPHVSPPQQDPIKPEPPKAESVAVTLPPPHADLEKVAVPAVSKAPTPSVPAKSTKPEYESFGEVRLLGGPTRVPLHALAVSADGRRVLSGGDDKEVHVWDTASGEMVRALSGHEEAVLAVALSADGHVALSGAADGSLLVWNLEDESQEARRLEPGHTGAVRAVALSADGKRAVSGGDDKTVRVWDVETGKPLAVLKEHQDAVQAVAISADGKRAVSGGKDKVVRLWSLEIRKQIHRYRDHEDTVRAVALSPDGRHILSGGSDGRIRLWDVKETRPDRSVWRFEEPKEAITCISFTADGRRALAGTASRGLIVLDARIGRERHRYPAPFSFQAVAVPSGDRPFVTAQSDGSVRTWDLPPPVADALARGSAMTLEGRQPAIHEANGLELAAWTDRLRKSGFLPVLVNGHDAGGIPLYAALAAKNPGNVPWEIHLDEGPGEVKKSFDALMFRKYWKLSESGYRQGASHGMISVWIPKDALPVPGTYHGSSQPGWKEFETHYTEQLNVKETRLATLSVYPLGGRLIFAGLWVPSDGTPIFPPLPNLDLEAYRAMLESSHREGNHPISVSLYSEGTEPRFAVVLHRDTPGLRWESSLDLSAEGLQQEFARQVANGLRPLLITGYAPSEASRYLAIWVDDRLQSPKRLGGGGDAMRLRGDAARNRP
jgi:serine/threonine protein kinase/WD40 repeat protein